MTEHEDAKPTEPGKPGEERQTPEPGRPKAQRSRIQASLAVASGVALVLVGAGLAVADQQLDVSGDRQNLAVPAVKLPITDSLMTCEPTISATSKEAEGTDSAYAPGADKASSTLRALALGDHAQRVPGLSVKTKNSSKDVEISQELAEKEAEQAKTRNEEGLSGVEGAAQDGIDIPDAAWLKVQALGGQRSPAAGVRTVDQGQGDLSGYATIPCMAPSTQHTLVGGSTTLGQSAVLVVTNPQTATASIDVKVSDQDGESTSSIPSFSLGPGDTRTINVAAAVPDAQALAVSVTSTGAPVTASVAQTALRGLKPGGIDSIQATAQPGREQVIPGISAQRDDFDHSARRTEDSGDLSPMVAVFNPGSTDTTARVTARKEDGKEKDLGKVDLKAQSVKTVSTADLPGGVYTVKVEADAPVAATARMLRGGKAKKKHDIAYIPAVESMTSSHMVALPEKGQARLRLYAEDDAVVTLAPVGTDGKPGKAKKVDVKGGTTQSVEAPKDIAGWQISATGGEVFESLVSIRSGEGLAAMPIPSKVETPTSSRVDLTPTTPRVQKDAH